MALEFRTGDLLQADAEALINAVDCVRVMGRGIAHQFKNRFPENFEAYASACVRGEVQPGRMFIFETRSLENPKYIINFPTKHHWREQSCIEYIESGLSALSADVRRRGIRSIAVPALGSGLGGLDWKIVRPRIESALGSLDDVRVVVYEPHASPEPPTASQAIADDNSVRSNVNG